MRLAPTLALLACGGLAIAADTVHLVPAAPGVVIRPVASAGDSYSDGLGGTKKLTGLMDGLGAWDNGDGTFSVVMNHEVGATAGIARKHGSKGAFVSKLVIDKATLAVQSIGDLTQTVQVYDRSGMTWSAGNVTASTIDRLCSGDLPAETAMYNAASGKGVPASTARFFFSGEESTGGRIFAHIASGALAGTAAELPHLGLAAWENYLFNPKAQDATVAVGTDDTTPGYLYVYVGTKGTLAGSALTDVLGAAGLTGGKLYGVSLNGGASESRTTLFGAGKGAAVPFSLVALGSAGDVSGTATDTNAKQRADSAAKGASLFLRPEDGQWDPARPSDFYFVTTDRIDDFKNGLNGQTTNGISPATGAAAVPQVGRSRLWRLRFSDVANPTAGGSLTCLIDGSEANGPQMGDNMTIDSLGRILIQEDPGNSEAAARIWLYDSGTLTPLAKFDPAHFGDRGTSAPVPGSATVAATLPYDRDEESSGIIDASEILGAGWNLLVSQAHRTQAAAGTEVVELGQLIAMQVPTAIDLSHGGPMQTARLGTVTSAGIVIPVRDSGHGSAMARVPGTTDQFWLMSDRGPNVDAGATTKAFAAPTFSPRLAKVQANAVGGFDILQTLHMARTDGTPITGLPLPAGTTGATGETGVAVNSDGTFGSTPLSDAKGLDPEGLVAHPDGTFWISDEYGPFIVHLDAAGRELERIDPVTANAQGRKLPLVLAKRRPNRGMEGLTLTPSGKLVGMMQSAVNVTGIDSNSKNNRCPAVRIVVLDPVAKTTAQYVYLLTDPATNGGAVSEITAINDSEFLVLERDGAFPAGGSTSKIKAIYKISLAGATDVSDPVDGADGKLYGGNPVEAVAGFLSTTTTASATTDLAAQGIIPVTKTLVADLRTWKEVYNHDKMEGLALIGSSLWVVNDDDFGVTDGSSALIQKLVPGTTTSTHAGGLQDYTQLLKIDLATITAANTPPALILSASSLTLAAGTSGTVTVTVGDVETAASALTLSGTASGVLGSGAAAITGSGATRTATITAGSTAGIGSAVLTVSDGSLTQAATVAVTVTSASGGGSGGSSSGSASSEDDSKSCGSGSSTLALLGGAMALVGLALARRRR